MQLRKDLLAFTASEVQGLQTTLHEPDREQTKLATHLAAIQSLQADANAVMPPSACSIEAEPAQRRDGAHGQRRQHAACRAARNDYFYRREELPAAVRRRSWS